MSFIKVMAESIKLMKGNKMAWFKLDLSFIGWYILNTVTLGFAGFLFVADYENNVCGIL